MNSTKEMQFAESRSIGVMVLTRFSHHYLLECAMCNARQVFVKQKLAEQAAAHHDYLYRQNCSCQEVEA